MSEVAIGPVVMANRRPLTLIAGMNVLETRDLALQVAERLKREADLRGFPLVFKASFDKANRSSIHSWRGPGLVGLRWLQDVQDATGLPLITDIHEAGQAPAVAEVVDALQIPAFLCRQTDLLEAACRTGLPLHIKKMQMMAADDMAPLIRKLDHFGHGGLVLCERGTTHGYGNLVVDFIGMRRLAEHGWPVSFDVTHAVQLPGGLGHATGGRRSAIPSLAIAAVATGLAGLFLEVHPEPDQARCDGPCATHLDDVGALLDKLRAIDDLAKSWGDAV